jgi:cytoskeleton protein RodZ
MDSVGELLRGERLRQGLELAHIAERLRINLSYLEAIEAGDTDSLPGAFFYRAFVRQYASLLGLEEQNLERTLSELRAQAEAAQPLPSLQPAPPAFDVPPLPTAGGRRVSGPKPWSIVLLIAVIAGCSGIYALWQRAHRAEPVSPPPARVETAAPPPQPQPVAQTAPAAPPPAQVETAAPPPQPQPVAQTAPAAPPPARVETAAPPPQPRPVAQTAPAAPLPGTVKPAVPPPAPEPAPTDAKLVIEVAALETVWISATTDGKKTATVLKPGQSRRFAANERASLFIGNAGGLEIRVNGKPLGPIGPRGQLRTVVITPEGVSITNPREKKEPPPDVAKPDQ